MDLEDPRLHETARMWKSAQHQINMGGVGIFVMLIIMCAVMGIVLSDALFPINVFPIAIIVGFGLPVLIYVIYTNLDKKDHWTLALPFNNSLFEKMETLVEGKIIEKGYTYAAVTYSGISTLSDSNRGMGYARAYAIRAPDDSRIQVRFALQVIRGKNHTTYLFPLEIRDVRMGNIDFARQVQADLMDILMGIDFLSYRRER
jgi:hypothetical protein